MLSDFIFQAGLPGESTLEFLLKQPTLIFVVLFNYVYFVKRCGPKLMSTRPAYDLHHAIRIYNIFQILSNAYLVYYFYQFIVQRSGHVLKCFPDDASTRIVMYAYVYNKWTDLIETCMFVMRKKQSQVSLLHVYHHVAVIVVPSLYIYTNKGGIATFAGLLNCGVHVMMYTYYLMTSLFPNHRALIGRIKPRLTEIQLLQFVLLFIHFLRGVFGGCAGAPLWASLLGLSQNVLFLLMFWNFYKKTYLSRKKSVE